MKKSSGITLIALIITIIIMLILVAVSVSIIINTELIDKSQEAADQTQEAYERESTFGNNLTIGGKEYSNIDEYMEALKSRKQITDIIVYPEGLAVLLRGDGKLYRARFSGELGDVVNLNDIEVEATPIMTDVKKIMGFSSWDRCELYYITNSNEYYVIPNIGDTNPTRTKIADNVKEGYGWDSYISTSNELYVYDMNNSTFIKIADNVKKGNSTRYLSNSNELYEYNGETFVKIANNVTDFLNWYYLNTSNELYNANTSTKIANNVKKILPDDYYLTNSNEIYLNNGANQIKKIDNAKDGIANKFYISTADEFYYYHPINRQFIKKADNVTSWDERGCWYKTNSGDTYLIYWYIPVV